MGIRATIARVVGLMQTIIGGMSIIFAFLLFCNAFDVQVVFGLSAQNIELYLFIIILFGLLSTISGLFLLFEQ